MARMTESELEETMKILYNTDRYLYDCLCIHLMELDKKIEELENEQTTKLQRFSDTVIRDFTKEESEQHYKAIQKASKPKGTRRF